MGSSCSSGQGHKDKDSVSIKSEGSPCYQGPKKESKKQQQNHASGSTSAAQVQSNALSGSQRANQAGAATRQGASASPPDRRKEGPVNRLIKTSGPSVISGDSMSLSSPTTATQSPRDLERLGEYPIPREILQLPENLQHLLAGRVAAVKPVTKDRKITIYVCATDAQDCQLEKGILHTKVYPELRRHCLGLGYELHVADLHWKTELEKKQDHEFPELCLAELKRQVETSYVIPMLFLGNSLGAPLLPKTVECQDFEMAVKSAEGNESKGLLQEWYGLDSHSQPPCYRLRPISAHIPDVQAADPALREQALGQWAQVVDRILALLSAVLPKDLRDTYLTTVVEQEVHNSVFMSRELAKRCVWLCRVFTHIQSPTDAQGAKGDMGPGNLEQKRRLEVLQSELKAQLSETHILRLLVRWHEGGLNASRTEHLQYLDDVALRLLMQMRNVIDEIVEDYSASTLERPALGLGPKFFRELMVHTCFCQKAAQCSVDCEGILANLQKYLTGDKKHPLVVEGPPGCGKTSLLSRAALHCQSWVGSAVVLIRFVGLTPESSTAEQILRGLIEQCGLWITGKKVWVSCHNMEYYTSLLESLLQQAAVHRPLVILLDGLDQAKEYGTCSTNWLPAQLPDGVKIVVSLAEESRQLSELRGRLKDDDCFLKIPPLQRSSAQELLVTSVMQYNHSVDSQIQDCVKDCLEQCTLPLYVKVLAWQTSCYSEQRHDLSPKSGLEEEITAMMEDMEQTLGSTRVSHTLSLMLAAKHGLSDSEALDLLSGDPAFETTETFLPWAPACLFWARLQRRLGPFLEARAFWRDRKVFRVACRRYLGNTEQNQWAASQLASYFRGELTVGDGRVLQVTGNYKRKLDELPYQTFRATGSLKEQFLFNWDWLYSKLCESDIFQVLEDARLESDPDVEALRKVLELAGEALSFDGRQLYSQVVGRVTQAQGYLGHLLAVARCPPVPSLLPLSPCLTRVGMESSMEEPQAIPTEVNSIYRLRGSARFVATLSTSGGEIGVWDVVSQRSVRTLKGIDHPLSLEATDGLSRCVILCGRELRIYNLDLGCMVTRLKGVMNQKMPYFGLHDPEHVVALSRNRMYVNLMNLESGDCVATFKVGEDRFLDSLLVSENGKILVCGDETQKPFPLLVWDLASRKLLYDLRIPHHEFITRLAAITYEGHFVCCVAREVDEPGPNFIIVYDLQSGTLFKKWKSGVSTVSIAISSQQGCVISGLEDARILVWDLSTGNCRWTLTCHRAPVDMVRLDQAGARFLSCDSQGRDRSLCLWDLTSGCLLSVFTTDEPVTACELSTDGQAVVLGLRGRPGITTLLLRHHNLMDEVVDARPEEVYGNPDNTGKVFQLGQEPR